MLIELSSNTLSFTLIIISIIVVFDILIKQKKSIRLKFVFLLIVLPILIDNILVYLNYNSVYLFNIFQLMKVLFTIGILQLFSNLYFSKWIKRINIISLFFLFSVAVRIAFTSYYGSTFLKDENFYYFFEIQPINTVVKVPLVFEFLRLITMIIFFSIVIYFWFQVILKFKFQNVYHKKLKTFTHLIIVFVFYLILILILKLFIIEKLDINLNFIISSLLQFHILIVILYRPDFLNRANENKIAIINKFNYSSDFELDVILFDELFFNQLLYLDKEMSIKIFSEKLGVDKDNLSIYIYNRFGLNFEDLVNKNRISYFIELIKKPQYNILTIDALAKESGFISRNAFYKPFKKFHGGNPSDLIELYS